MSAFSNDRATQSAAAPSPALRDQLALGLERIGLVPLRFPLVTALLFLVLSVAAAFGVARIQVDDSLSQLFARSRPNSSSTRKPRAASRRPSSTCSWWSRAGRCSRATPVERLRNLVTDLQLIDGTRGLISLFSARQPPKGDSIPEPIFPEELPEGAAYEELIGSVKGNEIIRGKLLAEDGTLALIVLALDPAIVGGDGLSTVVGEVRDT
jgi:hypothetical protein